MLNLEEALDALIQKYGTNFEKRKILEELNELATEIFRDINHGEVNHKALLFELADVSIMLSMALKVYNFKIEDFTKAIDEKVIKINQKYLKEEFHKEG